MAALIALTIVAASSSTGPARADVVGSPQFTLAPFTKGRSVNGVALVRFIWMPPAFNPPGPDDHQEVDTTPLTAPENIPRRRVGPAGAATDLTLTDAHQYQIVVFACQTPLCSVSSPFGLGFTRIDATPPSGSAKINNGAEATNGRDVTLDVKATDTLSGVTQAAIDVDGDGTIPCSLQGDASGCAGAFAPTLQATLTPGDGMKTVGVVFGDGAREVAVPCQGPFCVPPFTGRIEGNASTPATDTILLDTVKPVAIASQDRFTVLRGGSVTFDANASVDTLTAASGVDHAASTWDFKDGTSTATGARVIHPFSQVGTFMGELRVRDMAGNVSDPRRFSVTVNPEPSDTTTAGSLSGLTGTATFTIDRLNVRARYVRSRLTGSISIRGSSRRAGMLRAEFRRKAGAPVVAKAQPRRLPAGAFGLTFPLPPRLLPGTYRVAFIGPGGMLRTNLILRPPPEGVIRSGRVTLTGGRAVATFRIAAQPAQRLRRRLTVSWTQGRRRLGSVAAKPGPLIRAKLPPGVALTGGVLRAVLRAGRTVVGDAGIRLR